MENINYEVNCQVTSCKYNHEGCNCTLERIHVGCACNGEGCTCCEDYAEKY